MTCGVSHGPSGRPARSASVCCVFIGRAPQPATARWVFPAGAEGSQSSAQCLFSVPLAPLPDQGKPHGAQALGSANTSLPLASVVLGRGGVSGHEGPRADVHFKAPQAQTPQASLPPRAAPSARCCRKQDGKQAPCGHSEAPHLQGWAGFGGRCTLGPSKY